jgi:HD-like signal output (HDOD) protein
VPDSGPARDPGRGLDPEVVAVITAAVRDVTPLPGSVHDVLALDVKDPNLPEKLQAIVATDPVLTGHVIRTANSAVYRGHAKVEILSHAIQRVGAPMIMGTFLQSAISHIFDPYHGMGRELGYVANVEASLMAALAASVEPRFGLTPELAYVHGLLHDVGHLVLAMMHGPNFEALHHREIPADELAARETEAFGFDHQVTGRLLSNHWKLPEDITVVVASHHYPEHLRIGHTDKTSALIDLLAITDRMARMIVADLERHAVPETTLAEWLAGEDATKRLRRVGLGPQEAIDAAHAAVASMATVESLIRRERAEEPPS